MNKYMPYIMLAVIVGVVLYAMKRFQQPEAQVVPEFIGSDTIKGDAGSSALTAARAQVFGALASVAQTQIQADMAEQQTDAQLQATSITARIQQWLNESQERLGLARIGAEERSAAGQVELAKAGLTSQFDAFQADLENRLRQMELQFGAVQSVAQTYRNQSLERQGTILNAIGQVYGQGAPYDYMSSFGPPRPSFWSNLGSGLAGGINAAANYFTGGAYGAARGGLGGYRTPPFYPGY